MDGGDGDVRDSLSTVLYPSSTLFYTSQPKALELARLSCGYQYQHVQKGQMTGRQYEEVQYVEVVSVTA
jgi:hypothetical protein